MTRKAVGIVLILLLAGTMIFAEGNKGAEPYSPELGKATMQTILGAMMGMKPAMESGDFKTVEKNFMVLEESFVTMNTMLPPQRGSRRLEPHQQEDG